MSAIPGITCNDPAFEAAVTGWLIDSRMPLPAGLLLQIEVVETVRKLKDSREIFVQGDAEIRAGEPLGWVHISWRVAPAVARIDEHRAEATIQVSRQALEEVDYLLRSFMLVTLIFLWKRDGRYHVHAGTALDSQGRGWMLIGDSKSGKSTTTALLASRGWRVSTDDIAFLEAEGDRAAVRGFRSRIALRAGGFKLLGKPGGIPLESRGKTGFWPEELGSSWIPTIEPDIIVFTSIGGERTTMSPATPVAVMREMMQWSMWVLFEPTAAQEHLDLLARLGRQARCYHAMLAPDLFDAPRALEEFLP